VPVGFCCGGFSSTAGYVPGNEAHLAMSDFCSLPGGSLPKSVFRFYPENPEKVFQPFPRAKPFGFDSERNSNFFPSFVTLKRCVTAPLASLCTGQKPISIFDCIWSLHSFFFMSSRKHFRFCRYFKGIFLPVCGKLCKQF